jgi:hypothetical protein
MFTILLVIVKQVAKLFTGLQSIPLVGTVNTVLGGCVGAVQAVILLVIREKIGAVLGEAAGLLGNEVNEDRGCEDRGKGHGCAITSKPLSSKPRKPHSPKCKYHRSPVDSFRLRTARYNMQFLPFPDRRRRLWHDASFSGKIKNNLKNRLI